MRVLSYLGSVVSAGFGDMCLGRSCWIGWGGFGAGLVGWDVLSTRIWSLMLGRTGLDTQANMGLSTLGLYCHHVVRPSSGHLLLSETLLPQRVIIDDCALCSTNTSRTKNAGECSHYPIPHWRIVIIALNYLLTG